MTEVTLPLENTRFSSFFDFTVLRSPDITGDPFFDKQVLPCHVGFLFAANDWLRLKIYNRKAKNDNEI